MGDTRIDYSGLTELVEEPARRRVASEARRSRLRERLGSSVRWVAAVLVALVAPYLVLSRIAIAASTIRGWGTTASLTVGVLATAALGALAAWLTVRSGSLDSRRAAKRTATLLVTGFTVCAGVYVAAGSVAGASLGADEAVHPLVRLAAAPALLAGAARPTPMTSRTADDYAMWGLPEGEAALHLRGEDGLVRALDLDTADGRSWRGRSTELYLWSMGLHAVRHVGLANHLHVSLRTPLRLPGAAATP